MNTETKYWVWNTSVFDFTKLPQDPANPSDNWSTQTKIDEIFARLPLPFDPNEIHQWYNGGWSSEYNQALFWAIEYGLVRWLTDEELREDYVDIDGELI